MNLKEYIQGKRYGKEANQLEREAMNDPFLQDAIDGFDSVQGEHLQVIEALEKKIQPPKAKKTFFLRYAIISIAAGLALLIGIGNLMKTTDIYQPELAKDQPLNIPETKVENKLNIAADTDTVVINKNKKFAQQNKIVAVEPIELTTVEEEKIAETPIIVADSEPDRFTNTDEKHIAASTNNINSKEATKEVSTATPTSIRIRGISSVAQATTINYKGKVLDENGDPLMGASVKLRDYPLGTVTDMNGNFILPVKDTNHSTLTASYIGYIPKEIKLNSDSNIIKLRPNNLALNEVVTIGYGARSKKSKPDINESIDNALQQKSTGVATRTTNSSFGAREFKVFFENNRAKDICQNKKSNLKVGFFINEQGKAIGIKIINSDCAELEAEFMRLIQQSPAWTKTNNRVILTIRAN